MKEIPISQVDSVFAGGLYPIEFLLYYSNPVGSKTVRAALKKLSSDFWPVFGNYRDGLIQFEGYKEDEHFEEARIGGDFDRDQPAEEIFQAYRRSIPSGGKALFFLKMIRHDNGTILIAKLNHLAGDGYSYFYLLATLASVSKAGSLPFKKDLVRRLYKPHHNRTVLKEFRFEGTGFKPAGQDNQLIPANEKIPRANVRRMIKEIASQSEKKVSTNDVLSAMFVKKLLSVQNDRFGDNMQMTIPIDVRRYIKEYGPKFFGNGIWLHPIDFEKAELAESSLTELAIKIREAMPVVTKESYLAYLEHLEDIISRGHNSQLRPFDPDRGCLMTNLSRLPAHRLDFGSGPPDFINPLTIEKNSAGILAEEENFFLRWVV
jgi:hypothetical protein